MSKFIQIHMLTSYPPANPNRDDMGRPKSARMGGVDRLRISSQSLKRSWRTSDLFESAMAGHIGTRTKQLGVNVNEKLIAGGIKDKNAMDWAQKIAGVFGKLKSDKDKESLVNVEIEQLAHISPEEQEAVDTLTAQIVAEKRSPTEDELKLLRHPKTAVDIALFGRMLASSPSYNVDASCQVSHAISVHPVVIEDDYFTAVDDLNKGDEDRGAAHIGENGFAAALFYVYLCIDRDLLIENLGGDQELADRAVKALVETAVKVQPEGKQNSYAHRAYASYVLAEKGLQQPRSLSVAFLKPITGNDYGTSAVKSIETTYKNMDTVYGSCVDARYILNAFEGTGKFSELLTFVGA